MPYNIVKYLLMIDRELQIVIDEFKESFKSDLKDRFSANYTDYTSAYEFIGRTFDTSLLPEIVTVLNTEREDLHRIINAVGYSSVDFLGIYLGMPDIAVVVEDRETFGVFKKNMVERTAVHELAHSVKGKPMPLNYLKSTLKPRIF
jgi:hypothetical protein